MKQLQKSDLKLGEIYWFVGSTIKYLNKISSINIDKYDCYLYNTTYFAGKGRNLTNPVNILESTLEEKHWLETCIKENKFISYEEAMKTFIPEYVECTLQQVHSDYKLGEIYKLKNSNTKFNLIENNKGGMAFYQINKHRFKPSTKEAYDAQFVVKEPEFVLPEIWWVRITKENLKDISKFLDFNLGEYTIGFVAGMIKSYKTGKITKGYNSTPTTSYGSTFGNEITFDQFKQYILKENTTVIEEPKVVLEEPKDKVLTLSSNYGKESIVQVECSEGGVYRVGDKITVFTKNSPNKGKVFTIKSFRWTNDKSKICAVTELHTPNGIGLDKIELYVEPKVKDDFVLPEKWCIKSGENLVLDYCNKNGVNTYSKSELQASYAHFPSHDNCTTCSFIFKGYTEITFEQFKKYVLKDE